MFGRLLILVLASAALSPIFAARSCESITSLAITNTRITSAVSVPAGPFSPGPGTAGRQAPTRVFPAFCRVTAVASPVPDSEIRIEVWLPAPQEWNGKFLGTGNGGYSGDIGYAGMEPALRSGYATAGSDTGHTGSDLRFGAGRPEKIADWAYRAVHVMTETAKLAMRSYYGRFPQYSYFAGCSTGGQQALMEAQKYPEDYDGIAAGAPGNNRVRLNMGFLWSWLALNRRPESAIPASKLPLLRQAAMDTCDAADGLKDGLISDPAGCKFDPGILLCKSAPDEKCLTQPQLEAARKIYDGARNPRTGERLFAGWAPGSEASGTGPMIGGWTGYFVGQPEPARVDFWRYWVFEDPNWDPFTFDFDRDAVYALRKLGYIDAVDPDLSAFRERGGKLLIYHGGADPVVPPADGIRYFQSVESQMGGPGKADDFVRLYVVPGMGHCQGGPGPNTFNYMGELERWVARGTQPGAIVASHSEGGKIDRTRPLCPYPQVARWKGAGSIDEAESFECAAPR